jgi:hypothetical protein
MGFHGGIVAYFLVRSVIGQDVYDFMKASAPLDLSLANCYFGQPQGM